MLSHEVHSIASEGVAELPACEDINVLPTRVMDLPNSDTDPVPADSEADPTPSNADPILFASNAGLGPSWPCGSFVACGYWVSCLACDLQIGLDKMVKSVIALLKTTYQWV